MELWRYAAGLRTWRCRGMEIESWGGMLRARGRGGVEVWRSGDALQACRCGVLEVRCRRADVEVFASRAPEL